MADITQMIADLKQKRDEIRLQLHLGTKEAEDEWDELVGQWDKFLSSSQFDKSSDEVGEAAREPGLAMKDAYDRFKKALD